MISLANNHLIDYMDPGIAETLEVLSDPTYYSPYARDVDLNFTGGGMTREYASRPSFFVQNGLRIGFVGLCAITGHSGNEQPYFEAGYQKPGVLLLNEANLKNAVTNCQAVADVTIVLIHGGVEYSDYPSSYVQPLAQLAVDLGVEMVVCHHPHVSQGIEIYNDVPIIYSLGNYIFDQKYQHTMMSYMADSRIDRNGVHQLSIIPIYLERFVPKFLTGDSCMRSIHRLMRLSEFLGTTIVPDPVNQRGIVELGPAVFNSDYSSQNINLPTTYVSQVSAYVSHAFEIPTEKYLSEIVNISGVSGGTSILMGRDMLMFGSFEEEDIDDDVLESPGWTIPGTTSASISDYNPYEGDYCLRLRRPDNSSSEVNISSYRRIPVDSNKKYMVCGYVRTHDSGDAWVTVTTHVWPYTWDDWRDTEMMVMNPISGDNDWHYFEGWFTTPGDQEWLTLQLHLDPWSGSADYGYAYFDNIRVIEFDEIVNPLLPLVFPNPGGERYLVLKTNSYSSSARLNVSLVHFSATDTDNDGLWDFLEDTNGDGLLQRGETSTVLSDSDGDGLSDSEEYCFGEDLYVTCAFLPDTDGDGYSDSQEMIAETNPTDRLSHPTGPTATPTPVPGTPTPTPSPGLCEHTGDVDSSGDITSGDAQMTFLIALGSISPTYDEFCAADCDGSDDVTSGDAQMIFLAALGGTGCIDPI